MTHRIEVFPGTLELLVLKTLSSGSPMHGFGILDWLRSVTEGGLDIEEGALYPALHRMEQREWLTGEWGVSEKARRARYYRITSQARTHLYEQERRWTRYVWAWERIVSAAARV